MKDFWLNLPSKNIARSKKFFSKMGFTFNERYPETPNSLSLMLGNKGVVLMIFDEATFKSFTGREIPSDANEVLLSIDAQSKAEVDEMARKAIEYGGSSNHEPYEMRNWLYGCVFTDPDGHNWNVMYMDMNRMPKG